MPRQKTREELLDRIDELEAENEKPCRIRLTQSRRSLNRRRTTTRGEISASLRCRLAWKRYLSTN